MQKKIFIGVLALVVIAGGAYAVFHKSAKKDSSTSSSSSTGANTSANQTQVPTKSIIQTQSASTVGQYLADSSGTALYTYGADTTGVSNCSGGCLTSWPAYLAASSSATLPANVSVITRGDGTLQYAYKGMPLYTFYGEAAGQVTGDGVNNFHIAKP